MHLKKRPKFLDGFGICPEIRDFPEIRDAVGTLLIYLAHLLWNAKTKVTPYYCFNLIGLRLEVKLSFITINVISKTTLFVRQVNGDKLRKVLSLIECF